MTPAAGTSPTGDTTGTVGALLGAAARRLTEAGARYVGARLAVEAERAGERLVWRAERGGEPGQVAAVAGVRQLLGGASRARVAFSALLAFAGARLAQLLGLSKVRVTTITESIDIGVPVRVAYDQWTRYEQFPAFMRAVHSVVADDERRTVWQAKVFLSRRSWRATVTDQSPDRRVVWRSVGRKGFVDGAVTFHAVAPDLTRVLLVLEYHPRGLVERTGNLWRAQSRRARLEVKHFARHVSLQPADREQAPGRRTEIRDGRVVRHRAQGDTPAVDEARAGATAVRASAHRPADPPAARVPAQRRSRLPAGTGDRIGAPGQLDATGTASPTLDRPPAVNRPDNQ